MQPRPPVVGLLLHFRTPDKTLSCLQSLYAEDIQRVLVVDNSEDRGESLARIDSDIKELEVRGLHTITLRPVRNLGFAAGVNLALKRLRSDGCSDHVLIINSDAILTAHSISTMLKRLEGVACVLPRTRRANSNIVTSPIVYYQKLLAMYLSKPYPGTLRYPSGTCLMVSNDALRSSFFCDEFFFYGEDVMLGFDLKKSGLEFIECSDASIVHVGSLSSKNGSFFYEYHMIRGHWLLGIKLSGNYLERMMYLAARSITLPARSVIRCARHRSMVPVRALIRATFDIMRDEVQHLTPPTEE